MVISTVFGIVLPQISLDTLNLFVEIEHKAILKGDMDTSFGEILRRKRDVKGLGLRELPRRIGKSQGYLSDVEKDKVSPPSVEVILSMASALEVDKWERLRAEDKEVEYMARQPEAADILRKTSFYGYPSASDTQTFLTVTRICAPILKRFKQMAWH